MKRKFLNSFEYVLCFRFKQNEAEWKVLTGDGLVGGLITAGGVSFLCILSQSVCRLDCKFSALNYTDKFVFYVNLKGKTNVVPSNVPCGIPIIQL